MENKNDLRRALIAKRSAIAPELRTRWDAAICARLIAWRTAHPMQTLGIYWPIRGEPDLRAAYDEFSKSGVRLTLPIVIKPDAPLQFSVWKPGDDLIKDKFGVSVPAVCHTTKPDAVLVPCVGFTEQRFRLGYGTGFCDRTLALPSRPVAIGIAYACTLTKFDAAPHDIALDMIITNEASVPAA
jgi:5-formyltetrahydrofolate cyclo-ligase